jgi:CheY-like chemotaxis protein
MEIARVVLEMYGCKTVQASNGREALAALEEGGIDMAFMDNHMPDIDGIEVVRRYRLRELEQGLRRLPIVSITASGMPHEVRECIDAGMDDTLLKPFDFKQMRAMVDKWAP